MTSFPPDPYGTLGLDRKATRDQIKTSYRAIMRRIHPDYAAELYLNENPEADRNRNLLQAVQDAYELLADEKRRAEYDLKVFPAVTVPIQSEPPPSERIPNSRATPGVGTPRYEPTSSPVICIELTPNQCLKGGEVEIESDRHPLVLPYPAGIPNGYEIATSLGTVVLLYANTPTSWIVGRDLYRRFPVQSEQLAAGNLLVVKVGGRQFPVQLNPKFPFQEFVFAGAGLPAFEDSEAGNLYLIPSLP